MTLGRKLTADQPARNIGARRSPTGDAKGGEEVIRGNEIARVERGHEDLGQVMRRGLELRGNALTHRYVEGAPEIQPGEYAAYTARAAGDIAVTLAKSPAVPTGQEHPTGGARHRRWRVSLIVYHAVDANVSWPSGVVWSRVGYEMTGDPATLAEILGPPPNPRPADSADVFELTYDERTGQWIATVTHAGVAYADPAAPDPDATEPEPEPDPPEDGTDPENPPDYEYTDPETGDPMTPEDPGDDGSPVPLGRVVALHDGAFARTGSTGADWTLLTDGVPGATDIAPLRAVGNYVLSPAGVSTSPVLGSFEPYSVSSSAVIEIPISNGDFETGEIAPWVLDTGTPPLVLDITGWPPQRPGSEFYLASDIQSGVDPAFSVSQSVSFPGSSNGFYNLSAWFFVASGDDGGSLTVRSDASPRYSFDMGGIRSEADFNANQKSDPIRELRFDGNPSDIAQLTEIREWRIETYWAKGDPGEHKEVISIDISGWTRHISEPAPSPYPSSAGPAFEYLDTQGRLKADLPVVLTKSGHNPIIMTIPAGWQMPYGRRFFSTFLGLFQLNTTSGGPNQSYPISLPGSAQPDNVIASATADPALAGEWQRVEVTVDGGTVADIVVSGTGNSHVDDVTARRKEQRDETPLAVARNVFLRELWVATNDSLWLEARGDDFPQRAGPAPLAGISSLGVERFTIAAANGSDIALSTDYGNTWTTAAAGSPVSQSFAEFGGAWIRADGAVLRMSGGSAVVVATLEPGVHVAADRRGRRWLVAYPDGRVKSAPDDWSSLNDLSSMPASATAPARRILALQNGWTIGFADGTRDWFWRPAPKYPDNLNPKWRLGTPLKNAIRDLEELI